MGFFTFSRDKNHNVHWENLTTREQVEALFKAPNAKAFLFFKHSTRCSLSTMALNRFESNWDEDINICDLYFVDLIKNRDVSNKIEELTGVTHQSPQVIAVQNGKVIYSAAHSAIDADKIKSIVEK